MDRNWTIRPATDRDVPDIALAETARGPEPVMEREVREWDSHRRKDSECPSEWFVAVDSAGAFLGWGYWGKAHWLAKDESEVYVAVPPAKRGIGVGAYLLNHVEALAKRGSPKSIYAWGRGHDLNSLKWAQNRGYAIERERTEAELDLTTFDAGKYEADLARVRQSRIEIRTFWDDEINPYMQGLYKVDVETFRDVPFRSADAVDPSFDVWRLEYTEPSARRTIAIAFDRGEVVGFSTVWMPQVEGQSAAIGYTGVLREYRGRGIAFAVKVASTAEAAKAGAKKLMTGNDPDNPAVLHLNQKMGFRPVPGRVIFKKSLT